MDRDKLIKNIQALEEQGAKPDEIQAYIDSVGSTKAPEGGGFKGFVQDVFNGPAKLVASGIDTVRGGVVVTGTLGAAAMAPFMEDVTVEDIFRLGTQELEKINKGEAKDFGWFGGKVRPIGFTEEGEKMSKARTIADAAGVGLETAAFALPISKAYIPFKGVVSAPVGNIWKQATIAMMSPSSLSFGVGTGLQKYAETGDKGSGVVTGAVDMAGSGVAFGVFNRGGEFVTKFGSRLLSSKVGQTIAEETKNLFANMDGVLKGMNKEAATIDDLKLSNDFKGIYSQYENSFNQSLYRHSQGILDQTRKEFSRDPEIIVTELGRKIGAEVNTQFELAKTIYNSADKTDFRWNNLGKIVDDYASPITSNIDNLKAQLSDNQKKLADNLFKQGVDIKDIAKTLGVEAPSTSRFDKLLSDVGATLTKGSLKASEVLDSAYQLMGIGRKNVAFRALSPDEQAISRQAGFEILDTMEREAREAGRQDVLDILSKGRANWATAKTLAESNVLKTLKEVGNIDDFFSKIAGGEAKITAKEKEVLENALTFNPQEVQELFINALINRVKDVIQPSRGEIPDPKLLAEGAKVIDSFLEKRGSLDWAKYITDEQSAEMLRMVSSMMKTNFDDAFSRFQQMKGDVPIAEKDLLEMMVQKGQLEIDEALKKHNFQEVGKALTDQLRKNTPYMEQYIRQLNPRQQQLARVSLMHRLFDEEQVLLSMAPDGQYDIDAFVKNQAYLSQSWQDSFIKTHEQIKQIQTNAGDNSIYGLFDDETIKGLDTLASNIKKQRALENPKSMNLQPLVDTLAGSAYAMVHWYPAAANRFFKVMRSQSDEMMETQRLAAEEIKRLGMTNGFVTVGDFIQSLARFAPVPLMLQEAVDGGKEKKDDLLVSPK